MTARMIIATGMLLASNTAWAQSAPDAEKTTEALACELVGNCAEVTVGPAEPAAPAAVPDDRAVSRIPATKGFSVARKVLAPASPRAAPAVNSSSDYFRIERDPNAFAAGKGNALPEWRADLHVSFVTGSSQLTEAGRREAQKFASALGTPILAGMRFIIEGHTDAVGARGYNVDLSRRRAQAVVDYLVAKGADRSRFNVVGYGFDKPLDGHSASDSANRRVEVVLVK